MKILKEELDNDLMKFAQEDAERNANSKHKH